MDEQYGPHQLLESPPRADHVALCLPLTPETEDIVGERELWAMKSSAWLINVGRGQVVDGSLHLTLAKPHLLTRLREPPLPST